MSNPNKTCPEEEDKDIAKISKALRLKSSFILQVVLYFFVSYDNHHRHHNNTATIMTTGQYLAANSRPIMARRANPTSHFH